MRKVLFSVVKDEGPFLLEWVAYHRAIGFDAITIVSKPGQDGTVEMLDALAAAGVLRHVPLGQAATEDLGGDLLVDGDWGIWLDADEFLCIHAGDGSVDALIAATGDHLGTVLCWKLFGDDGHDVFPGRFVSPDFVAVKRGQRVPTHQTRHFFRKDGRVAGFGGRRSRGPVPAGAVDLVPGDFLGGSGRTLRAGTEDPATWSRDLRAGHAVWAGLDGHGHALAQINHYSVRTPDMFVLRGAGGKGLRALEGRIDDSCTPEAYLHRNVQGGRDDSILRHQDAVSGQMDLLLSLPGVAAAQRLVGERLASELPGVLASAAYRQLLARRASIAAEARKDQQPVLTLPEREAALVADFYGRCGTVLEYGSGGSTFLAASKPGRRVFAVESCEAWTADMHRHLALAQVADRVRMHHVDIGATGSWGRPRGAERIAHWPDYPGSVWDRADFEQPEVILIDGRFRLGCFLTALQRITRPATILWDDYTWRRQYHAAETVLGPVRTVGRMAQFDIVPGLLKSGHQDLLSRSLLQPY